MVLKAFVPTFFLLLAFSSVFSIPKAETNLSAMERVEQIDTQIQSKFGSYENLFKEKSIPNEIQKQLYEKVERSLEVLTKKRSLSKTDKKTIEKILDQSYRYRLDMKKYDFYELTDRYNALTNEIEKETFRSQFFTSLSFIAWNYQLSLTDASGNKASLFSEEKGACIGGGLTYSNAYWGALFEGCYAYMTATVGEDSTSIRYNQTDVPVDALLIRSGAYWRPNDDVRIGIYPALVYHKGSYTPPSGGSIRDDNELSLGAMIASHWAFNEHIGIKISLGDLKSYKSSIWLIGFDYTF